MKDNSRKSPITKNTINSNAREGGAILGIEESHALDVFIVVRARAGQGYLLVINDHSSDQPFRVTHEYDSCVLEVHHFYRCDHSPNRRLDLLTENLEAVGDLSDLHLALAVSHNQKAFVLQSKADSSESQGESGRTVTSQVPAPQIAIHERCHEEVRVG